MKDSAGSLRARDHHSLHDLGHSVARVIVGHATVSYGVVLDVGHLITGYATA